MDRTWRLVGVVALFAANTSCRYEPGAELPKIEQTESAEASAPANELAEQTATFDIKLSPPELLSAEEIAEGWIALFDGQTLFGWQANNDVDWSVADGVIHASQGDPGLLLTAVPFADFELRFDFNLAPGGNSGVFLRTIANPTDPARDCYELNICDSHAQFPTGSIVGRAKASVTVNGEGSWKTFHVRAEGTHVEAAVDGETVIDFTDTSDAVRLTGLIGLQKNEGEIEFRNVVLKPLGAKVIFGGDDLTGWRQVPGSKSAFEVVDGAIQVTKGPGFLETEQTWSDFVLQAEVRVNGRALNSGIFFRAMPGTEEAPSNGYEFQIQNGFKNGDRMQPADAGTGAIFRRAAARYVVANDEEWFTATLVAHGPRMMTWVNGYPVVDWEDTRPPNENPREGLRLEAGHISLQGHDPTTNIQFRNIRVSGYPQ
jgi:hypothetical protein